MRLRPDLPVTRAVHDVDEESDSDLLSARREPDFVRI